MKKNNYLSTILILIATVFSFYIIGKNFLSQVNQGGIKTALPLLIPALILIIPLIALLIIMIIREVKYGKLLAGGVKSVGIIKKSTQTGNYIRKRPEVKFELTILEEDGAEFNGEVIATVHSGELEFLKEGEAIPIIYKSNDKKQIYIDRKPNINKLKEQINKYRTKNNIK
ncbi:hypothetical protein [Clostridium sp. BL-8]|uniref:hypothetical protein n=1 Tax=Clostridium sp. BL-8 TaxID=349938 RepID=UPI00098C70D3|nr:hypothetical protein [Clostridium sp. BL-8]OOM72221.1 hypothetical protein CLOBL_48640 [Clostridium sp. BL-8]